MKMWKPILTVRLGENSDPMVYIERWGAHFCPQWLNVRGAIDHWIASSTI